MTTYVRTWSIRFVDERGRVRKVQSKHPPTFTQKDGHTYAVEPDPERGGNNLIARRIK